MLSIVKVMHELDGMHAVRLATRVQQSKRYWAFVAIESETTYKVLFVGGRH